MFAGRLPSESPMLADAQQGMRESPLFPLRES